MWIGQSLTARENKRKAYMLTKLILVFVLFILAMIELRQ